MCAILHPPSSILYPPSSIPGLGVGAGSSSLEAGVWSLQPHPGGFLLGRARGFACGRSRGSHPPWRSPWRLSSPILPRLGAPVRHLGTKMPQHLPRSPKQHHLGANIFQRSSPNSPKTGRHRAQGQRLRSNLNGFGVAFRFHLRSCFFNLSLNSSWQPCLKFGTVAALRAQRTGYISINM